MLKILLFISIAIVVIFLIKRITGFLMGMALVLALLFIAIFLVDNFTSIDMRKYIPLSSYDDTVKNPKETAEKVKDKVYETGEGAIHKVNEMGDKTDEKYGTETDSQKEKRLEAEKEKNKENTENESENSEDVTSQTKEDVENEKTKSEKTFIKYKDLNNVLEKDYKDMPESDKKLALSIVPNLTIEYTGKEYKMWNTSDNRTGLYIKKIK